jgi:hypothetical protein
MNKPEEIAKNKNINDTEPTDDMDYKPPEALFEGPAEPNKFMPGPEDYGGGGVLIELLRTAIQDMPLKINLLRLFYITNLKNFISEFWNIENDDDNDLAGISERVKGDLKDKIIYIDEYANTMLETSTRDLDPDTRTKIRKIFKSMSVSSLPVVNLYHFYANIYNLLNMDKYARMTKGIAVKELEKHDGVMNNIMSLKNHMTERLDKIEEWLNKNETKEQPTEEQKTNMPRDSEPQKRDNNPEKTGQNGGGSRKKRDNKKTRKRKSTKSKRGTKKHKASRQKNRRITNKRKIKNVRKSK